MDFLKLSLLAGALILGLSAGVFALGPAERPEPVEAQNRGDKKYVLFATESDFLTTMSQVHVLRGYPIAGRSRNGNIRQDKQATSSYAKFRPHPSNRTGYAVVDDRAGDRGFNVKTKAELIALGFTDLSYDGP